MRDTKASNNLNLRCEPSKLPAVCPCKTTVAFHVFLSFVSGFKPLLAIVKGLHGDSKRRVEKLLDLYLEVVVTLSSIGFSLASQ